MHKRIYCWKFTKLGYLKCEFIVSYLQKNGTFAFVWQSMTQAKALLLSNSIRLIFSLAFHMKLSRLVRLSHAYSLNKFFILHSRYDKLNISKPNAQVSHSKIVFVAVTFGISFLIKTYIRTVKTPKLKWEMRPIIATFSKQVQRCRNTNRSSL